MTTPPAVDPSSTPPIAVGRYVLHRQIARGGMATIHLARVLGDVGFSRIVAAKRLRPELADDREFVAMFLDEARIASKVHHRNVVPVLDVGTSDGEVVLVQEYVHGAPLSYLLHAVHQAGGHVPLPVAVSIACHVLAGLHAAHETCDELGTPLHIIHRDVSPQNVMVATDGTARLLDFGIAKASACAHVTRKGTFKGKLAYAAPEQIRASATPQSDIFSLAVVLWELIVGVRLHARAQDDASLIQDILTRTAPHVTEVLEPERALSGTYRWKQLEALAPIVAKGLAIDSRRRWATALEMEEALTNAVPVASTGDVAAWLRAVAGDLIAERDQLIASEEAHWRGRAVGTNSETARADDLAVPLAAAEKPAVRRRARTRWSAVQRRLQSGKWVIAAWSAAAIVLMFACGVIAYKLAGGRSDRPRVAPLVIPMVTLPSAPTTPTAPPVPTIPVPVRSAAPIPAHAPPRPAAMHVPTRVSPTASSHTVLPVAPQPQPHDHNAVQPPPVKPATPPATDCTTPYYFQGDKKLFKPACI